MEDIRWNELLPGRKWRPCKGANWARLMPAPSAQLSHLLPKGFEGSCALHAYSETLTVILRRLLASDDICVDLPELLRVCLEKGVLRSTGTSPKRLKDFVNSANGIPLQGSLPDHFVLMGDRRDQVDNHLGDISAMGSKLSCTPACPLPFGSPTSEQAEAAMTYREQLCSILQICPVVICYPLQEHYGEPRNEGEPYRQLEGEPYIDNMPWWYLGLLGTRPVHHCVTAFGYDCPGGDVRTMRIHYQENATGAPDDQPGRHVIDPDAVEYYYLPLVDTICFRNRPVDQ